VTVTAATDEIESYRRELTGYCYRMLGSAFEADDAVQETMLRAWKAANGFEGRSSLRSWLYRIATNVCLDALRGEKRRALPMDLGPSSPPLESHLRPQPAEDLWITPIPDARVVPESGDPAEIAAVRESVRLAFVTALQHLPARQRAALILCEVLKLPAAEAADVLDSSVASVNSALQRARATLDQAAPDASGPAEPEGDDARQQELFARYVDCFERYDVAQLVTLLHDDATFQMPPFELWLRGPEEVGRWMLGQGIACKDAIVRRTWANGCPAIGIYKDDDGAGIFRPFNLMVIEMAGGEITGIHNFLYPHLFPAFGLPAEIPAEG
jgi:RNA polymerase sigma-70 factor (ECF subfamily)